MKCHQLPCHSLPALLCDTEMRTIANSVCSKPSLLALHPCLTRSTNNRTHASRLPLFHILMVPQDNRNSWQPTRAYWPLRHLLLLLFYHSTRNGAQPHLSCPHHFPFPLSLSGTKRAGTTLSPFSLRSFFPPSIYSFLPPSLQFRPLAH